MTVERLVYWALLLAAVLFIFTVYGRCDSGTWGLAFHREDLGPQFRLFVPSDGKGGLDWKKARVSGFSKTGGRWEKE